MYWLLCCTLIIIFFWLFGGMLTPFLVSMVIAYALNPLVSQLMRIGLSRPQASAIIIGLFVIVIGCAFIAVGPSIKAEIFSLAQDIPRMVNRIVSLAPSLTKALDNILPGHHLSNITGSLSDYTAGALLWVVRMTGNVVGGGLALANFFTVVVITPIISFYMLKDWPSILNKTADLVPRIFLPTATYLLQKIDVALAAFARGQVLVCLSLACYYSLGLTFVGLDLSLVIGMSTGFFSFIPYVGFFMGLLVGCIATFVQFSSWLKLVQILMVFGIGAALEGYFLTPKLVGNRVGLHPLWIIFSVFAGGHLGGLSGILIALPSATIINVLIRFSVEQYKKSRFYSHLPSP